MKKITLLSILFLGFVSMVISQNAIIKKPVKTITGAVKSLADKTDPQTPAKRQCGTMQHLQWMQQQNPVLKQKMETEENNFNEYIKTHYSEIKNSKTNYVIPVVVHIVYNTPAQNISDARVIEQINQTNSDWAGTNARSMQQFSSTLQANSNITFCLATIDPNGNPTTGITRTQTSQTSFIGDDKVKSNTTGGCDGWDPTRYLNIWVCNLGGYMCGYSEFPTPGLTNTYGSVVHYEFFGLTGAQSPYNGGATLTHELGHCFNLYHIWGDDMGSCSGDDYCSDTPKQADYTLGAHSGCLTDNCTPSCPGIMYMNFMDYSNDAVMANITPNQATRMQACILTYLSGPANNSATACSQLGLPIADFSASATNISPGTTVNFTDLSTNSPTSWQWNITPNSGYFFAGGTSTASQNPIVTFNASGNYTVALTVSNSYGSNTNTKTDYIIVSAPTSQCDTFLPPGFGSYCNSVFEYTVPNSGGYITGNNINGDLEKAQKFNGAGGTNKVVTSVLAFVYPKTPSNALSYVRLYSVDSTTKGPANLIATSNPLPFSTIIYLDSLGLMAEYTFSPPVSVPNDFFVSVVLPDYPDTLVVFSTEDGCYANDSLAWELWNDGTWHSIKSVWSMNFNLVIVPIVCTQIPAPPVADFSANSTVIPVNTSVLFSDQSSNLPSNWQWNISPASGFLYAPGSSPYSQNPEIIFNTIGYYTVELIASNSYGSDTITRSNYITVAPISQVCDTAFPPVLNAGNWCNLAIYVVPYSEGYAMGNNAYGDLEKAEKFVGAGGSNKTVSSVLAYVCPKTFSNALTYVKLYSVNAITKGPENLLATSNPVSLNAIDTSNLTEYTFSSPVPVPNDFFVSVVLPDYPSDTLVVVSTEDGCFSNDTLSWELWADGTWSSVVSAWGINIDLVIAPIVCPLSTSCTANFSVYPDSTTLHHYFVVNNATGTPPVQYIWSWGDGSPDDTAAFPTHTYSTSGFYNICLTVSDSSGCTDTFCKNFYLQKSTNDIISVTVISPTVGIEEHSEKNSVLIYPNPASSTLSVELGVVNKGGQCKLYNAFGTLVAEKSFTGNKFSLDVSNLAKGLYLLKVESENGVAVRRFIKE